MFKKREFPLKQKNVLKFEKYIYKVINFVNGTIPAPKHFKEIDEKYSFLLDENTIHIEDEGDYWKLGFSECIITPQNIQSEKYYVGGNISFPPRKITHVIDNIKVRTIALSTEKSKIVTFSVVDCIGLTNVYVNKIRKELTEFCKQNSVESINIFSTHSHSSIDSMGIWSASIKNIVSNYVKAKKGITPNSTVNETFIDLIIEKTKESIVKSVENMQLGEMFLLEVGDNSAYKINEEIKKKIGFNSEKNDWDEEWQKIWTEEFSKYNISETGIYEYILSKRSPYDFSPRITRIRFSPLNNNIPETMIVNLSAHPYSNGLKLRREGKGDGLSGDFVYYMEKTLNQEKYNMIFFNGAINGVYPKRKSIQSKGKSKKIKLDEQTRIIGNELASIVLLAGMTTDEIYSNKTTNPQGKSPAYQSVFSHKRNDVLVEHKIKPILKLYNKSIFLKCTNPLEQIIGKLNFAQFDSYKTSENDIYVKSEIGFIKLGDDLNIALIPGEITNTLCNNNVIYESKTNFISSDISSIEEILGDNTLIFGLANDSIGYIIHPDDYYLVYVGNGILSKRIFGENFTHYQEIFSLGENIASELLNEFKKIKLNNNF